MGRRPIPPLCGGAVQALPNFQTTLRDHPHPASRPMTFGHFTSWRADDRGYYTGAWVQDDATTRACAPHGIFSKGRPLAGALTSSKEFAKIALRVVTFLWRISHTFVVYNACGLYMLHMIWNKIMIHMIRPHKIVGHFCRAHSWVDVVIHK